MKNCVACHKNFVPSVTEAGQRFADFCTGCLQTIQDSLDPNDLFHGCQVAIYVRHRKTAEDFLSATAWAVMWFAVGLASAEFIGSWLFQ